MIADNAPSSDWEVLRWHVCREGVFLLFTGSCSLMPGQYASPEKGWCEGNDLDLYLEGNLFASWSDIRLSREVFLVRISKNTDL